MESMASREDGLASLCTGYPPILTHAARERTVPIQLAASLNHLWYGLVFLETCGRHQLILMTIIQSHQ